MKALESLVRTFVELHPEDAAHAFESLSEQDTVRLLGRIPLRVATALMERLSPHETGRLVEQLPPQRQSELLTSLTPRTASAILQNMEDEKRDTAIELLPEREGARLRDLARYPPQTAGGIMEPRVVSLPIDLSVGQAITTIRKAPRQALHYLYVTRRSGELVGVINMRDLLLAGSNDAIEPLVRRKILTVPSTMDRDDVIAQMRETGFLALPVVDVDNKLIGVVKHDEALHASQLEAFEDLQILVGAGADERALSPVSTVIKSRLPWLFVNLLTAFLAAAVVGAFEGIIAQMAALAVLLPVVAGQGGNTGSQSLAVVMRGLALREIIPGAQKRVIVKELLGGLINGVSIAAITAGAVFAWRVSKGDSLESCSGLALVIGLAMIVNMAAAALAGAVIPMLLRACGRDPAQSASIFLTTVTDVVGFASFLGFAVLFQSMFT